MASWTKPMYSRGEVDRSGKALIDPQSTSEAQDAALLVLNNWRSSHSFPLNTFQVNLRRWAPLIDDDPLSAQRLKRVPSILAKLNG